MVDGSGRARGRGMPTILLTARPNRMRLERRPLYKTHIELLKRFELGFVLDVTEYERNL